MKKLNPKGWERADYLKFYTEKWHCSCIPCADNKHPIISWAEYQETLTTDAQYAKWFTAKTWGISVVMREGLFSIDCDSEELFQELKQSGAFPRGACIYKSKRGYHIIMRAERWDKNYPYSVQEHMRELTEINELYFEIGIGGAGHLAIAPNTPDRYWLPGYLYDSPVTVNYEEWLEKTLGWSKRSPGKQTSTEGDIKLYCPIHPDETTGTKSLIINSARNSAHCFGCGFHGNLWDLQAAIRRAKLKVPVEVSNAIEQMGGGKAREPLFAEPWADLVEPEGGAMLIKGFLPGGENAKLFIIGPPKVGKTELAVTIAVNAAQGKPVLGKLEMPGPLRVMYGNFEQSGSSIKEQIINMRVLYGLPPPEMLYVLNLKERKLNDDATATLLLDKIQEQKTNLLILDSMYLALDGWNDEPQARKLLKVGGTVVDELHCALIALSHSTETGGGFLGSEAKVSAVSMMGKYLERWAGSVLTYTDLPESRSRYYGKLEGTIRGGIGFVSYCVAYSSLTHAVKIMNWDEIPVQEGMEQKVLRKQDKVLFVQQLVVAAEQLGYNRADVARMVGVGRDLISDWFNGKSIPSDGNWSIIQEIAKSLIVDNLHD